MKNCHIIHKLNKTWRLKPATKGKKVLKVSQTLKMKCLVKKILKVNQTLKKKKF